MSNADTKQEVAKEATKIRAEFAKSIKECKNDKQCKASASFIYFSKRDNNNARLDK